MKVLLLGGCGFIGSHVADAAVDAGLDLRIFDRGAERFRPPLRDVEYIVGDFGDTAAIKAALIGVDAVVHLASSTVPSTSNADPVADILENLVPTVSLLQTMRAMNINKIVYLSSGGTIYGIPETEVVTESHPSNPISSYGIVKLAIEKYLYLEEFSNQLQYVALRASNPYGPRQGNTGVQGVIGTHLWRTARGEKVEVWGDGSIIRDFIHVRDLANLCLSALLSDKSGSYNAGSGHGFSILDIVMNIDAAVQATGGSPVIPVYKTARSFDVPRVVLDISRTTASFNWRPLIGLKDGIAETWDWVRNTYADRRV